MIVVAAAWFPLGGYWQSDDFAALHYASNWSNVWNDFSGPQYNLQDLVWFYRPLITLSFGIDSQLAEFLGAQAPMIGHLSNTVAHTISALLVALLGMRFVNPKAGFCAGLIWGLSPALAGSVFWAAGRVDSHTTMWILLCIYFFRRWIDKRSSRWPAMIFLVLALLSKETAMILPGILGCICLGLAAEGHKIRKTFVVMLPYAGILLAYLIFRHWMFGDNYLGGYEGSFRLAPGILGLSKQTMHLLNPLMHSGGEVALQTLGESYWPNWIRYLGFLPAIIAVALTLRRKKVNVLACTFWLFILLALPTYMLWASAENPKNLRNFYLPMVALAILIGHAGWLTTILALLVAAFPFIQLRQEFRDTWESNRLIHQNLITDAEKSQEPLFFVDGLAKENDRHTALAFDIGVDSLLRPPFADSDKRVFALRQLNSNTVVSHLPYGKERGLPFGLTLAFDGAKIHYTKVPKQSLASLLVEQRGNRILSIPVLDEMAQVHISQKKGGSHYSMSDEPVIRIRGMKSKFYRITIFTAGGYVTARVRDSSRRDDRDGRIYWGDVLMAHNGSQASTNSPIIYDLQKATTLDILTEPNRTGQNLGPAFPVMVELDSRQTYNSRFDSFRPTHANKDPLWIRLDRRLASWLK